MTGNDAKVLLDMSFPAFQDELFDLDASEFKKVCKTLKKLKSLAWNDLFRDSGLNWEQLKSAEGKYSIGLVSVLSRRRTARGPFLRFQSLHLNHDGAYRKK